jgi:hypothetical protein
VTLRGRRLAAVAMAAGLGLTGLAQLMASPHPAPLFDGVLIEDPYRYVAPQASAAGGPLSAEQTQPVVSGAVPLLAVGTAEVPPQAQIIAQADAFDIPAGTSSITISIRPSAPTDPQIVGNVYSLKVTDQAGVPLTLRPGSVVTIVLRSPDPNVVAQVARFDGTTWVPLQTENGGLPDLFSANITAFGDFALRLTGTATNSPPQPSKTSAAQTPLPSTGSGGTPAGDAPNWIVIAFVVAAIGVGLAWGVLGGAERR